MSLLKLNTAIVLLEKRQMCYFVNGHAKNIVSHYFAYRYGGDLNAFIASFQILTAAHQ